MKPNDIMKKKVPPEFVVISSKPTEITEEQRQEIFEIFDGSIDKLLAAENKERIKKAVKDKKTIIVETVRLLKN